LFRRSRHRATLGGVSGIASSLIGAPLSKRLSACSLEP
jgi:hypothetical protein